MNAPGGRRWPPAPRKSELPGGNAGHAGLAGPEPDWPKAIGDLTDLLRKMLPGSVLGEDTYQLSVLGQAADQYKIPFAALAISSNSASQLFLTADTLKIGPPPSGPGVAVIPPRGFAVVNMKGYAWSVYGGSPGDQITIQAFTRPQPPVWEAGPLMASQLGPVTLFRDSVPTVQATQARTTPTAGQVICTITPGTAGLWEITGLLEITGVTVAAADSNNMALNQTAAARLSPLMAVVPGVTGMTQPVPLPTVTMQLSAADTVNVTAIALGTTGAVYTVTLIARRIG